MPTYTVQTSPGHLDADTRAALAAAITQTHAEVTGAPTWFAQVVFQEVPAGRRFLAGRALDEDLAFVSGTIRGGGRDPELKRHLATELAATVARLTRLPSRAVWVYLVDLPPDQMVEFGRTLPEPGQEQAWLEEFPGTDRDHLRRLASAAATPGLTEQ